MTNDGWITGYDANHYGAEGTKGALAGGEADGTLKQYAVVRAELVLPAPRNLGFEEAASTASCAGTAMHALESIKVGEGTGAVRSFVILLAVALGGRAISTSSSDEKLQAAKSLSMSELIDYKTHPNWSEEVLRLTDGKGEAG